jgi:hypothetical protein
MADLLRAFEEELQSKNFKGYRYSSGQKKRWFKFPIHSIAQQVLHLIRRFHQRTLRVIRD